MPEFFKGDAVELQYYNSAAPILNALEMEKDAFYNNAFSSFLLGEVLWNTGRTPLSNAIPFRIFRESFATIFSSFAAAGTFEAYLTVFRNIFGDTATIAFTVPAPGKLQIAINASVIVVDDFIARRIESNAYVFDEVVTHEGDIIGLQTIKGFQSQYELERMLFEMVPAGIYTQITLTLV